MAMATMKKQMPKKIINPISPVCKNDLRLKKSDIQVIPDQIRHIVLLLPPRDRIDDK